MNNALSLHRGTNSIAAMIISERGNVIAIGYEKGARTTELEISSLKMSKSNTLLRPEYKKTIINSNEIMYIMIVFFNDASLKNEIIGLRDFN